MSEDGLSGIGKYVLGSVIATAGLLGLISQDPGLKAREQKSVPYSSGPRYSMPAYPIAVVLPVLPKPQYQQKTSAIITSMRKKHEKWIETERMVNDIAAHYGFEAELSEQARIAKSMLELMGVPLSEHQAQRLGARITGNMFEQLSTKDRERMDKKMCVEHSYARWIAGEHSLRAEETYAAVHAANRERWQRFFVKHELLMRK